MSHLIKDNIYTRFHTKSAVLLRRIKNQNIDAEMKRLIVETLGPLQGRHEVFKDCGNFKKQSLMERMSVLGTTQHNLAKLAGTS